VSLRDRKTKDRLRIILLAGPQDRGREIRLIGAVGKVLSFEAESATMDVRLARLSDQPTVQEISAVELHTRLGGVNFQHTT